MLATNTTNRWIIALAGTVLQVFLGTVYAWSYFQKPLVEEYGWSNAQVAGAFGLAICFLGLSAAWGGVKLPIYGPRKLSSIGSVLFGLGYIVAAAALHWRMLPLLYLGYGVIDGAGIGLCYVTPVATVAKWFPDKKGLATGIVIMGFGFGALLMSKIVAPVLFAWFGGDLATVFFWLGVFFMAATLAASWFLCNPPTVASSSDRAGSVAAQSPRIASPQFAMMWMMFFCNILAGISIISFQSPIFQDLWQLAKPSLSAATLAAYGATLIAVSAVFNGIGRMFWGGLSDRIGRLTAFRLMLGSQLAVFLLMSTVADPRLFGALVCYVLLCYGGGFGTMPSFVIDVFGSENMAKAYGAMLTAWSAAGVVGPQISGFLRDRYNSDAARYSFYVAAVFLSIGLLLSLTMKKHK